MALENILNEAVKGAVSCTVAEEVQVIVAKEVREREDELTALVRAAVASAITEMSDDRGGPSSA